MPVTHVQYFDENAFFGVWTIEETLQDLQGRWRFTERESMIYEGFRTENRRLQWIAYRLLLKELLADNQLQISYDAAGKPYLEEHSYHISVSHTQNFAAVAISKTGRVGIDIEVLGRDLSKIASKFCSDEELNGLGNPADTFKMTLLWCAKEALYKLYGLKQLDFRQHIKISNLDPANPHHFTGTILNPKNPNNPYNPIPLTYFKYGNLVIVIAAEINTANSG